MLNISKITELRKQRGWDQQTLAKEAGVDPSLISRLERGLQEDFKLSVVISIANALEVLVDSILEAKYRLEDPVFEPELAAILNQLGKKPGKIQLQVAAMLKGYLNYAD